MDRLIEHGRQRHAPLDGELLRYASELEGPGRDAVVTGGACREGSAWKAGSRVKNLPGPGVGSIGEQGHEWPWRLVAGADDFEVLVDEDVVRPVDAEAVDLVLAVAEHHDTVDDASRVGG